MQCWSAAQLEGIVHRLNDRFLYERLPTKRKTGETKHPYNSVGDKQANRWFIFAKLPFICSVFTSVWCSFSSLQSFFYFFLLKHLKPLLQNMCHNAEGSLLFFTSFSSISSKSLCQHIQSSFERFRALSASWDRPNIMGTQLALIRPAQTQIHHVSPS